MTITAYPLLRIRWIDARQLGGWEDTDKAIENCNEECLAIESTGRLIYEGEDRLVLVSDMSEDGKHVNNQMIIPRSAVLDRQDAACPSKSPS